MTKPNPKREPFFSTLLAERARRPDVVMWLLVGESLEEVSRNVGVEEHRRAGEMRHQPHPEILTLSRRGEPAALR